jgi:hypothetical protein
MHECSSHLKARTYLRWRTKDNGLTVRSIAVLQRQRTRGGREDTAHHSGCHCPGSYKTYFRPLRQIPLPYPLAQGETVKQSVSLVISDQNAPTTDTESANETAPSVSVRLGGSIPGAAALPRIGVGVPPAHAKAMATAMRASAGNTTGDLASLCIVRVSASWCSESFYASQVTIC